MEEIDEYINKLILSTKEAKFIEKDVLKLAQKQLETGQILLRVGKQKESVEYLQSAWQTLRDYGKDPKYDNLFHQAGILLTEALDYVGDVASCEIIFQELNSVFPEGFHLGEYAYFLHRRKREFDKAERFVL